MMTSCYANLDKITPPMSPVRISRAAPRWMKGGWKCHCQPGVIGRDDLRLAPTAASLKATDAEYDRAFAAILAQLDPRSVFDELGDDAVLLCFCDVIGDEDNGIPAQFCHRRVVAEWFEFHLGVVVPELGVSRDDTYVCTTNRYPHYVAPKKKLAWIEQQLANAKRAS